MVSNPMKLGSRYLTEHDLADAGFRHLGKNVRISERCSMYGVENISLRDNVRIDDFTFISAVNGSLDIGSYVHVGHQCFLGAGRGIVMQDFAGLSSGVRIYSVTDDYSGQHLTNPTVPEEFTGASGGSVILERHVIVGTGTVILPACTIGEGAAIGALSLVTKDLAAWGMYAGIPVRRIKDRKNDLLELERRLRASSSA
jgi:acetyltransferase-like isoleucine patch superfamily enzyme